MANIEVSAAAGAGFKLIGSRPVSVFIWGLFIVLLVFAPSLMLFLSVAPQVVEMVRDQSLHPSTPAPVSTLMPVFNRLGAAYSVMGLGGVLSGAIINAAVYRAVIEPRNRGFAYLRFGMKEIWLVILSVAQFMLWIGLVIAAAIPVTIISIATTRLEGQGWGVLAGLVSGLAAGVGLIFVALRLSMAAPMTFAEGEFRLFESWRLTRGHAWQIFLVALLMVVILLGIGIVVNVVERLTLLPFILTFATAPHAAEALSATFRQPPSVWLKAAWPVVLAAGVGFSIYLGVMRTLVAAPWATVYRMLKGEAAAG